MMPVSSPARRVTSASAMYVLDAVAELVEHRQAACLVRGAQDLAREAELREEIGLDGPRPLRRGAADVRQRVERVHVAEDDGLELGLGAGRAAGPPLQRIEHRALEAPLHHRMNGRRLLLDHGLDARRAARRGYAAPPSRTEAAPPGGEGGGWCRSLRDEATSGRSCR